MSIWEKYVGMCGVINVRPAALLSYRSQPDTPPGGDILILSTTPTRAVFTRGFNPASEVMKQERRVPKDKGGVER